MLPVLEPAAGSPSHAGSASTVVVVACTPMFAGAPLPLSSFRRHRVAHQVEEPDALGGVEGGIARAGRGRCFHALDQ